MSVRDRLERIERREIEDKLDYVPRVGQTVQPQAAATTSVRQRAEMAAFLAEEEATKKVTRTQTTSASTAAPFAPQTSVRNRLDLEKRKEFETASQPTPDVNAAAWAAMHAKELKWKADDEQKNSDTIKRNEDAKRFEQQQHDEKMKMLAVDLMLGSASTEEIANVKALIASNYPADKFNPEKHWLILMKFRAEGIFGNTPKLGTIV